MAASFASTANGVYVLTAESDPNHALVFDVQRAWDELAGEQPRMWTVDRDHTVWDRLRG